MEWAITTISGVSFNKNKSKTIAHFLIPTLLLFTAATNIPKIIDRRLLEDNRGDEKRIWCIVEHSSSVHFYNLVANIIHFCGPFGINLISALIVIVKTARLRTRVANQSNHRGTLCE